MGEHIEDNKLVITAEPKTFHFDLPTLRSRINGGNGGGVSDFQIFFPKK